MSYTHFEHHDGGTMQAVRIGPYKALRSGGAGEVVLYNLTNDPAETRNIAADHPDIVKQAVELFQKSHTPSADWPAPGE